MSQRKPMSQQNLVERLSTLERRIDEATRRSTGGSVPIGAVELGKSTSVIEFDHLPQHFHALHLEMVLGGTQGGGTQLVQLRVNGHTSGYDFQYTRAAGSETVSGRWNGVEHIEVGAVGMSGWWGEMTSQTTATLGQYAETSPTWVTSHCGYLATGGDMRTWLVSGWAWDPPEAIDRISLHPSGGQPFRAGSTVRVYGMR